MTTKVDGTNGVLQSYDFQVLTTGFSYTFAAGTQTLVINPAGTLATGTITMPAAPVDGMVITIESTQQVTAVSVLANSGQTLVGAPSQLIPNQPLAFLYRLANTTWYPMAGGAGRATALVSGTAQLSTSGTSIDFTGIPSWVKRITVMFFNVSTNGTSYNQIQIGSGSFTTSGYTSQFWSGAASSGVMTTGFGIFSISGSSFNFSGSVVLTNMTGNTWASNGNLAFTSVSSNGWSSAGSIALAGTLDRVRITTVNGTDTFDAGTINIMYE
jgi:hypothetical protein